jgi:hypothetical protein
MDENLSQRVCFALNPNKVAQENQYSKSYYRAKSCCVIYRQERKQHNKSERNPKSSYEVANSEHSRVFLFCGG